MKDLCIREVYTKDGAEKVSWNKIGVLIDGKEGKQYVKLYHIPGQLISVFEQKKKETGESKSVSWEE
jgi:hypothetical protein